MKFIYRYPEAHGTAHNAASRIRLLTYLCVLAVHRTAQGH